MSEDPIPAPSLPTWQLDASAEEIFLVRNGPVYKGTQAGVLFASKEFTLAEINKVVADLNIHAATQRALEDCVEALKAMRTDYKCVFTTEGGWSSAFDNLPCVKQADDALAQAARITGAANGGAA